MTVKELSVADYRNIEKINITPSESVNVIYGENAQGKTNLLEYMALYGLQELPFKKRQGACKV